MYIPHLDILTKINQQNKTKQNKTTLVGVVLLLGKTQHTTTTPTTTTDEITF